MICKYSIWFYSFSTYLFAISNPTYLSFPTYGNIPFLPALPLQRLKEEKAKGWRVKIFELPFSHFLPNSIKVFKDPLKSVRGQIEALEDS